MEIAEKKISPAEQSRLPREKEPQQPAQPPAQKPPQPQTQQPQQPRPQRRTSPEAEALARFNAELARSILLTAGDVGALDPSKSPRSILLTANENRVLRLPDSGLMFRQQEKLQDMLADIHEVRTTQNSNECHPQLHRSQCCAKCKREEVVRAKVVI
jgi:hypothetical protein